MREGGLAQTLKKLHPAQERGKRELEEERVKDERERIKLETELEKERKWLEKDGGNEGLGTRIRLIDWPRL